MAHLIIRGFDAQQLSEPKARAASEQSSVNTFVRRWIAQGLGHPAPKSGRQRHDDLDGLAGTWDAADGEAFDAATMPFGEVNPALWT